VLLSEHAWPGMDGVFQVDLISIPPESFDFARRYFRFSDLGNLIGRIARSTDTVLKHDGLYFQYRDGDLLYREILLTRDFDAALRYLGFEPDRYHDGFEDLDDVFEYVG